MRTTFRVVVVALVVVLAGQLVPAPARAQLLVDVTFEEYRCLAATDDRMRRALPEPIATVVYMVNSGTVVLSGTFRGCTFALDDPALAA
jgi:hypothetical protein